MTPLAESWRYDARGGKPGQKELSAEAPRQRGKGGSEGWNAAGLPAEAQRRREAGRRDLK